MLSAWQLTLQSNRPSQSSLVSAIASACSIRVDYVPLTLSSVSVVLVFFLQGQYLTAKDNQLVYLHPSTCLDHKPEW